MEMENDQIKVTVKFSTINANLARNHGVAKVTYESEPALFARVMDDTIITDFVKSFITSVTNEERLPEPDVVELTKTQVDVIRLADM